MTSPPVSAQDRRRAALAYGLGIFTGVFFLMSSDPRPFVRFHAWQSTVGSIIVIAAVVAMDVVPIIGRMLQLSLLAVALAVALVCMARASRGAWTMLPIVGDIARDRARVDG